MKDYELKTTKVQLAHIIEICDETELPPHDELRRVTHDALAAHEMNTALAALEAERDGLRRILGQATVDMWIEGEKIMMQVGDDSTEDCVGPFEYDRVDEFQELADYLTHRGLDDVPDMNRKATAPATGEDWTENDFLADAHEMKETGL